jgi:hypothetical protein
MLSQIFNVLQGIQLRLVIFVEAVKWIVLRLLFFKKPALSALNFDEIVKSLILTIKGIKNMNGQKIYNNIKFMLFMSFTVFYKIAF